MRKKRTIIAVVIPSYKVKEHILGVIEKIGPEVSQIYVVDDCCPVKSGDFVRDNCNDERVRIEYHQQNLGVGGAVMTGYRAAIENGADVIVKIDGDGQMDPALLPYFALPIIEGWADYTKGNRFYDLTHIGRMPKARLIGNAGLSFMTKISTGYWNVFDPTNGYTAISAQVASHLPLDKISQRYFFETDMLFRLNTLRAVVADVPMDAHYADEESNLKISKVLFEFSGKHASNLFKRIFYNYFLRDMTAATFELVIGGLLLLFGLAFGVSHWISAISSHIPTPLGTIMVAALPILIGLQLILSFLNYDVANTPSRPIGRLLPRTLDGQHAVMDAVEANDTPTSTTNPKAS
ncbi:glycosyltransferase family 2 protein [Caballeronia concitans]|uniref:Undecaprenyl-phosphate mannosyltransferase n=1 Tax=Caballeronia concitans TaxID=1777133 RepID=A0A658QZB2_9BURK|nr:glycosyltransferase family 2 protein [Caballeronia concitans]SAL34872.1 Undecaprenyl-phosphate mannosyltransferase [Caballeronia concitans]